MWFQPLKQATNSSLICGQAVRKQHLFNETNLNEQNWDDSFVCEFVLWEDMTAEWWTTLSTAYLYKQTAGGQTVRIGEVINTFKISDEIHFMLKTNQQIQKIVKKLDCCLPFI